jgi:hypothetical protein
LVFFSPFLIWFAKLELVSLATWKNWRNEIRSDLFILSSSSAWKRRGSYQLASYLRTSMVQMLRSGWQGNCGTREGCKLVHFILDSQLLNFMNTLFGLSNVVEHQVWIVAWLWLQSLTRAQWHDPHCKLSRMQCIMQLRWKMERKTCSRRHHGLLEQVK